MKRLFNRQTTKGSGDRRSRGVAVRRMRRQAVLERLEERTLLSVVTVNGDQNFPNENDSFLIQLDNTGTNLQISLNGVSQFNGPIAGVTQVNINGLGGNDTLTVDSSHGLVTVPIFYDGGSGINKLALTQTGGATQTSETEGVGALPGLGVDTITGPSGVQVVQYQNLAPVFTNVPATTLTISPATLPIFGIAGSILNASNAINYADGGQVAGLNTGVVTIDNAEPIQFNEKANLVIDSGPGSDVINLNDPTIPDGLTGTTTVNGGDPTGTGAGADTLIVNSEGHNLILEPTGAGAGTVSVFGGGLPSAPFTGIESLQLVDTSANPFGIDGTAGNDQFQYTPGATPDTGTVTGTMNGGVAQFPLVPVTFVGMQQSGTVVFNAFGQQGGNDTFVFNGTAANNNVSLTNGGVFGGVTLGDTVNGAQFANLNLANMAGVTVQGHAGDTYTHDGNIPIPVTYAVDPSATLNFNGNGSPVTVNLAAGTVTDGAGTVTLAGVTTLNVNANGAVLTVKGTATAGENLSYTPTGVAAGTVTASDSTITTNFTNVAGATPLTIDPGTGSTGASVTVLGTNGDDLITATSGASPTVQVNAFLPVTLVPADTTTLFVKGLAGSDNLTVDSTAGAFPIPINYDGGGGGTDSLTLRGGAATSDTYTPGAATGSGTSVIAFAAGTQTVNFVGLSPMLDLVPSPLLTVNGTNGPDAINYTTGSVPANGLVSVNNLEPIEFSNKVVLAINGLAGSDEINLNNPNTPTGLTTINVDGGDPTASDTLIVNGTPGADTIGINPLTADSGNVTVNALPIVNFTTIENLKINGQGGSDALTYTTPGAAINTAVTFTPGTDATNGSIDGRVLAAGPLVPVSYSNVDNTSTLTFAHSGGGRTDDLHVLGTTSDDTFNVGSDGSVRIVQSNIVNVVDRTVLLQTPGISQLDLHGLGGNDTFNITGPLPFVSPTIVQADATVNYTAVGTNPVTVNLQTQQLTDGATVIQLSGVTTLNVNANGAALTVMGTSTTGENLTYNPTGAAAGTVTASDSTITTNFTNVAGASPLTIDPGAGSTGASVTVLGTNGNDQITATAGAPPTVQVGTFQEVTLVPADTATLVVKGQGGNDNLTVDSTAGAFPIPITYDGGTGGGSSLTLLGGTALGDTYTPGSATGSGTSVITFAAGTQTVNFAGLSPVIDLVAAPLLTVNGTNGNDAINYTTGPTIGGNATGLVSVNNLETIEFTLKTALTINGLAGSDEINLNNPTVPTGLTGINVNGGDPTASDKLIVNGTTGTDTITYTTSATLGSGSVAVTETAPVAVALPTVNFTGIENLAINGLGAPAAGGDTLTVVTQPGADTAAITPGAAGDAGHIDILNGGAGGTPTGVPLDFLNLGNGLLTVANGGGGRADTVVYNGTPGNDNFSLSNVSWLLLNNRIPVIPAGATNVVLNGLAGDDTFTITAANLTASGAIASMTVNGGAGGANDVLDFTADGKAPVSLNLPDNTTSPPTLGSVTETGLTPILYTGLAGINVNSAVTGGSQTTIPAFTVNGTTGVDNIAYTPLGAQSGNVTSAGLSINFANVAGTFTIDPKGVAAGGNGDTVTVNGTPGNDIITASGGAAAPVVSFSNGAKSVSLVALDTALLAVNAGAGNDNLVVDSTAGAFPIPVLYDGGSGIDTLTLQGGTATSDVYTAGPNPGQGNSTLGFAGGATEVVNFVNLAPVIDFVPSASLTVNGTNDNDAMGYSEGYIPGTLVPATTWGLVTLNNLETLDFINKDALTLNGGPGDDVITINNPNRPTGSTGGSFLSALTVIGGLGNDTLVVNANNQPTLSSNVTNTTVNIPGATPVPVTYDATTEQVKIINAKDALTGTGVPVTAPIGIPVQDVLVATFKFTDPQPPTVTGRASDFIAQINWGDGTTPTAGTIIESYDPATQTATFQVFGSHTFTKSGPLTATVTVFDNGSLRSFTPAGGVPTTIQDNIGATTAVTPIVVTVSGALLTSQGTTFAPTEGTSGTFVVATFVDSNPAATVTDFTTPGSVSVNWGDGNTIDNNAAPTLVVVTQTGASGNGVTFQVRATHTYIEEGTYQVLVTITSKDGSSTIATSDARVADSPPTAGTPQPTLAATEDKLFNGPVASFFEVWTQTDPVNGTKTNAEPAGDFVNPLPTINWGDGSPYTVGTVVADPAFPAGSGHYLVMGSHVYTTAGGFPTGTFPVTTTITDDGGTSLVVTNPVTVTEVPVALTGQLNPASDSGKSHTDGITNVSQPNFFGTTEPFADVELYANGQLVGQTEASSDGSWSITTNHLADGSYVVTAEATDIDNPANTIAAVVAPNLVIDTVGPRITFASFDRFTSTAQFTFVDPSPSGNGPLVQSLSDAANYHLQQIVQVHGKLSIKPLVVTSIEVTPGGTSATENVTVTFNNGRYLVGGYFQLIARSESPVLPSGIQDVAGNALDGEFYGPASASGNGVPGGDFVANFTIFHNRNSGPQTIIGFPHPNDPPASFPTGHSAHRSHASSSSKHPSSSLTGSSAASSSSRALHPTVVDLVLTTMKVKRDKRHG